ncbi:MAG: DUF1573 domain-containing protein [candidate division Zixibacteria bacterium]|nr:DUF1573 domain-containing protein [candidate division Zixibacteria bacterium]
MTETAIPPGGEGKIEVTFDSKKRRGKSIKHITVESNDPVSPKESLTISAYVEAEFGFETNSLNMGRIRKGESVSRTATLLLKDTSKRNLLEIGSKSSHIDVQIVDGDSENDGRIEVEVTVNADDFFGRLDERVTANLTDGSHPESILRIIANIIGNVEVNPRSIHFIIDTALAEPDVPIREIKVFSNSENAEFKLLSVMDTNDLLTINADTLIADKQYRILTRPNQKAMNLNRITSGFVKIKTDDPEQPEISFSYRIILR